MLQPAICRDAVQAARDAAVEAGTAAQQQDAAAQATLSAALHAAAAVTPGRGPSSDCNRSPPGGCSSAAEEQLFVKSFYGKQLETSEAASAALASFDVGTAQPQTEAYDAAQDLAQQQESNARLRSGLAEALRRVSAMTPRSMSSGGPAQMGKSAPAASRLPSAAAPTADITTVVGRLEHRFASPQRSPQSDDLGDWSGTKRKSSVTRVCYHCPPPSSLWHAVKPRKINMQSA